MEGIYHLQGTVKHYDWGGKTFIPSLLQLPNPGNLPFAEYWLGVHPLGISAVTIDHESPRPLTDIVGQLSYLLKVLDVRTMLSIQVHPTRPAAEAGFREEEKKGIAPDAPGRNYRDANHKPELMVALGDFWLLHGFKPVKALTEILQQTPEWRSLLDIFGHGDYKALYTHIMQLPQEEVNQLLQPLAHRLSRDQGRPNDLYNEDYWAARAFETFPGSNIDRGIFSIYLFNVVHLKEGEGIFQAAGVPHAYLRGQNVEIMANSDNVLRGGLTTKHIDVPELLKHVRCEATVPAILHTGGRDNHYPVPVPDFGLHAIHLEKEETAMITGRAGDILLLTRGVVAVQSEGKVLQLGSGHPAALLCTGKQVQLSAIAPATVFRATGSMHNR